MAFDAHKNFAYSTVATAPSPASSGTSLIVASGEGTKFPAVPFNATVWPAGAQPTTANSEIVRVTNISTDTFTITRTQESTSARSIGVGDQIAATITAKTITDIEAVAPRQLAYVEFTAGVTISGSEGSPTDIVSAGAVSFDGATRVRIDFFAPVFLLGSANSALLVVNLWDGSTDIGRMGLAQAASNSTGQPGGPIHVSRFLTPSNASHTYKIRGWASGANGTVDAGAGGAGVKMPGYIRITVA